MPEPLSRVQLINYEIQCLNEITLDQITSRFGSAPIAVKVAAFSLDYVVFDGLNQRYPVLECISNVF